MMEQTVPQLFIRFRGVTHKSLGSPPVASPEITKIPSTSTMVSEIMPDIRTKNLTLTVQCQLFEHPVLLYDAREMIFSLTLVALLSDLLKR